MHSGFAYVLSLRKQELQSNSFPRSEIRIARKLSKLELKVQLRNFPSVEQIQDTCPTILNHGDWKFAKNQNSNWTKMVFYWTVNFIKNQTHPSPPLSRGDLSQVNKKSDLRILKLKRCVKTTHPTCFSQPKSTGRLKSTPLSFLGVHFKYAQPTCC